MQVHFHYSLLYRSHMRSISLMLFMLQTIMRSPISGFKDGVLTPIPQYPLYSALITLLDGNFVPYYLDESDGWNCSVDSLQESLAKANEEGISTRALVIINPGNPTGQILSVATMREIGVCCSHALDLHSHFVRHIHSAAVIFQSIGAETMKYVYSPTRFIKV